jgi:hypothetical protein
VLKFLIYVASNSISQWRSGQWSQIIEDDESDIGESKIHSVQNGLLLSQTAQAYFDKYMIAINPDVRMFISTRKIILTFSRTITKSPVSLMTFTASMVGRWSSETVPNDISPFKPVIGMVWSGLVWRSNRLDQQDRQETENGFSGTEISFTERSGPETSLELRLYVAPPLC